MSRILYMLFLVWQLVVIGIDVDDGISSTSHHHDAAACECMTASYGMMSATCSNGTIGPSYWLNLPLAVQLGPAAGKVSSEI